MGAPVGLKGLRLRRGSWVYERLFDFRGFAKGFGFEQNCFGHVPAPVCVVKGGKPAGGEF